MTDKTMAELVRAEAATLAKRGGMVSADWVAMRLEHIAEFACRGPQNGRSICVHNGGPRGTEVTAWRRADLP